jgi:transcriptional regulator GlxA family with amidase domain
MWTADDAASETRVRVARLDHAASYIRANYAEPLDLQQVARQAFFSPFHFHRLFRSRYGRTPHEILTAKRLAKAQSLLRSSELSVTEICYEVGFQSLGSFSQLFSKNVGEPPLMYRRRVFKVGWDPMRAIPWCLVVRARTKTPARP